MNIFWLSRNIEKNARYHCDKHVVKMCVEYTQILSTAYRVAEGTLVASGRRRLYLVKNERLVDGEVRKPHPYLYKATHHNHPCNVWARSSLDNWKLLRELALELCAEYTRRYGKVHACEHRLRNLPVPRLAQVGITPPPLTMPDEYKQKGVVASYRAFYLGSKSRFASWKHSKVPSWYTKGIK